MRNWDSSIRWTQFCPVFILIVYKLENSPSFSCSTLGKLIGHSWFTETTSLTGAFFSHEYSHFTLTLVKYKDFYSRFSVLLLSRLVQMIFPLSFHYTHWHAQSKQRHFILLLSLRCALAHISTVQQGLVPLTEPFSQEDIQMIFSGFFFK